MESSELEFLAGAGGTGVTLRLRVAAGASRSRVTGPHGGALKVSVKAPPEKGKANEEVVALVARRFGLVPSEVEILRGASSPDKVVSLSLTAREAERRWRDSLE